MRLNASLLGTEVSLNSFKKKEYVEIHQGETVDLYIQLVDDEQGGMRYVPSSSATVYVEIARYPEPFATITNLRDIRDYSIRRNAASAFVDDRSIWKFPLTATDTDNMMSSNIRVTVTDGSIITKALIKQAIKIIRKEG